MENQGRSSKVYQFDPGRKKKLKSVDYVSPEKKKLLQDRKQSKKDRKHFFIGAGIFLLVVLALTYLRLRFW